MPELKSPLTMAHGPTWRNRIALAPMTNRQSNRDGTLSGFDGVEIHGAHGYLVAQFLDSTLNHSVDGYGSTYDGRARLLREIVDGVRAATDPGFQVGLRLSPERFGFA